MIRSFGAAAILLAFVCASGASPPPEWLQYDDGTPYQPVYHNNANDGWAVKFTPAKAGYIQRVKIYVGNPPGNSSWDGFNLEIWKCSGGTPSSRKWGPQVFSYSHGGWVTYKNIDYHWNNKNPFVILVKQRQGYPNCDTLYCDPEQTEPNPNWSYFNYSWLPFTTGSGDFLLRVYYGEAYPAVGPTSLGRVKALYR